MSDLGNFPGKHGKKHDCLTSFNIKQQINSNLRNTVKNCAPITSVPATMTVLSWRDLPIIWSLCFCLPKRKRNKQMRYIEAWTYAAISKNKLLQALQHVIIQTSSLYRLSAAEIIDGWVTKRHYPKIKTKKKEKYMFFLSIKISDQRHTNNLNIQKSVLM
jgi:hypothetical protein